MGVGSRSGGGDLCTSQESPEEVARTGGGAMRTRVCARVRTPHGVGALLLVGGAIVGAAVVAWRRRGDGKGAKNDRRGKENDEVLDGGAVENEQRKSDQSNESLRREDTEVGANALFQDGKETEELHEIQKVEEIVSDELDSGPADKFDPNLSNERAEIIDDTNSGDVRKPDQNSAMSCVEDEITPNVLNCHVQATEGVKDSDQSALTISSLGIAHEEEHSEHRDAADQETTSTQMAAHQSQTSKQLKVDNKTETSTVQCVSKHEEQKPPAQEPVAPIASPVSSSLPALPKPAEKKRPANTGLNETGMKLGQNSGSKKGAAKGVAVVSMDRRSASVAILAIIFAVTIGVNVIVRLYSSLRAT